MAPAEIEVGLTAAIVAVAEGQPLVLAAAPRDGEETDALPFGPFDPVRHRTFETGLRAWVGEQTGLTLGYVEQLYTFGDRGRHRRAGDEGPHVVSVGYLALTRAGAEAQPALDATGSSWRAIYRHLPWEDWRAGTPAVLGEAVLPALLAWVEAGPAAEREKRRLRLRLAFGHEGLPFDEERVLERYELLYEAGLTAEAVADGRTATKDQPLLGLPMRFDHRRVLATALARLRSKLKYRPVIFELMAREFTLTELQTVAEAIAGRTLHKQNFRRFVETTALVEATGGASLATGGRPAALFRFRPDVLEERPSPGIRFGRS